MVQTKRYRPTDIQPQHHLQYDFFTMAGLWLLYRGLQLNSIPQDSYLGYNPVFAMVGEMDVTSEMFLILQEMRGEL